MTDSHYEAIDAWDELISKLYGKDGKCRIEKLIERMELGMVNWLPRWTILVGGPGSGKTTLTRIIFQMFNDVTIPMTGYNPMNYGEYGDSTLGLCLDTDFDALYAYVTKNWRPITNYHLLVETTKEILLPRMYTCIDEADENAIFKKDYGSSTDNIEVIHTTGKTFSRLSYNELVHKINEGIPELKLYFRNKASADYIERIL